MAADSYNRIVGNADVVLYGDRIGFTESTGEFLRTPTQCQGTTCVTGVARITRPSNFSAGPEWIEQLSERNGVTVVLERSVGESDFADAEAIGGWLEHSFFATQIFSWVHPVYEGQGVTTAFPYVVGNSTGENPSLSDGSARWEGLMFGRDVASSSAFSQVVEGDAAVTVEFGGASLTADVAFSNIADRETGAPRNDMAWRGLALKEGGFSRRAAPDDTISGRFFGPNEEEVGGIFERDGIAGAFGGVRAPE